MEQPSLVLLAQLIYFCIWAVVIVLAAILLVHVFRVLRKKLAKVGLTPEQRELLETLKSTSDDYKNKRRAFLDSAEPPHYHADSDTSDCVYCVEALHKMNLADVIRQNQNMKCIRADISIWRVKTFFF